MISSLLLNTATEVIKQECHVLNYSSCNVGTSFANLNSVIGHLTNAMKVNECCYNNKDVEDLMTLKLERYKRGQPDQTFIAGVAPGEG